LETAKIAFAQTTSNLLDWRLRVCNTYMQMDKKRKICIVNAGVFLERHILTGKLLQALRVSGVFFRIYSPLGGCARAHYWHVATRWVLTIYSTAYP
jgi:hypothetical protein